MRTRSPFVRGRSETWPWAWVNLNALRRLLLLLLLRLGLLLRFLLVLVVLHQRPAGRADRRAFLSAHHRAARAAHDGALRLAVLLRRLLLGVRLVLLRQRRRGDTGDQERGGEHGGTDPEHLRHGISNKRGAQTVGILPGSCTPGCPV